MLTYGGLSLCVVTDRNKARNKCRPITTRHLRLPALLRVCGANMPTLASLSWQTFTCAALTSCRTTFHLMQMRRENSTSSLCSALMLFLMLTAVSAWMCVCIYAVGWVVVKPSQFKQSYTQELSDMIFSATHWFYSSICMFNNCMLREWCNWWLMASWYTFIIALEIS